MNFWRNTGIEAHGTWSTLANEQKRLHTPTNRCHSLIHGAFMSFYHVLALSKKKKTCKSSVITTNDLKAFRAQLWPRTHSGISVNGDLSISRINDLQLQICVVSKRDAQTQSKRGLTNAKVTPVVTTSSFTVVTCPNTTPIEDVQSNTCRHFISR